MKCERTKLTTLDDGPYLVAGSAWVAGPEGTRFRTERETSNLRFGAGDAGDAGGDRGRLVFLKFPDEPAASLELVHRPDGGRVDVGSGFDHLGGDHIELDLMRRLEDRDVTHLRYRVRRRGGDT